jgi:hypothetical protein
VGKAVGRFRVGGSEFRVKRGEGPASEMGRMSKLEELDHLGGAGLFWLEGKEFASIAGSAKGCKSVNQNGSGGFDTFCGAC